MALYSITTKHEFTEYTLNSSKVVLVDFWASWCPPCRAMAPILEHLSQKYDDIFDVVSIDIEKNADMAGLAAEYKVQGIPNMIIFNKGRHVDTLVGMTPQTVLEQLIKKTAKSVA